MSEQRVYRDVGFWPTKKGTGYTVLINERVIERLKLILEAAEENSGGTLYFGEIKREYQKERGPTFKLDYIEPNSERTAVAPATEGV